MKNKSQLYILPAGGAHYDPGERKGRGGIERRLADVEEKEKQEEKMIALKERKKVCGMGKWFLIF